MADTLDLGSSASCVRVQVSPPGPYAALVQLAERLLAKEKATGSSPVCCSKHHPKKMLRLPQEKEVPCERVCRLEKYLAHMGRYTVSGSGADCKSVVLDSGGSTPSLPTNLIWRVGGDGLSQQS